MNIAAYLTCQIAEAVCMAISFSDSVLRNTLILSSPKEKVSFKKEKYNAVVLCWIFTLFATAWGGAFELIKITLA